MPVEVAKLVNDFNKFWPRGTDPVSKADDHIRMIKEVLQLEFELLYNKKRVFSFEKGAVINPDCILYYEAEKAFYQWNGAYDVNNEYIVNTGSTPTTAGGIGAGAWTRSTGSGFMSTVLVSDTKPTAPFQNMLWWDTNSGTFFIYYNDGTSTQWVDLFGIADQASFNTLLFRSILARLAAESGYTLVGGSFQEGAISSGFSDVVLDWNTAKFYQWHLNENKEVPIGSTPETSGGIGAGAWVDRTDVTLRSGLASASGVNLVGGAASEADLQVERNRISVLQFAKFEQYQRSTKIANILRDGVHNNAPVAFTISLFGDSTMWGSIPFNTTSQDPKHPGVALKQALDLIYQGNAVTVVNAARPCTTLKQLLNGTDGGGGTYADRIAASPTTQIVYCNHCLNDCGSYESTLSQYRDNLVVWVNTTRAYGKIPVLVTPSLISPIEDGREEQMKRQPAFIQAMRDVASTMSVDLVDNFKFTEASAELYKPQDIALDGVHLSQLFYQQAGWNMAIPLINPHVIRDVGDVAGLSTSAWADNITEARAILDTHPTRFSAILTGDAIATTQAVNFPVVLAKPTSDTVLAVGCALTGAGGTGQLTYFGFEGQPQFDGIIDYKSGANSDFDCLVQPVHCALPAGLSIVGVKINTSTSPAPNVNFTFSGVQLIDRVESGFGYSNNSGYQLNRDILVRDEISTHQYVSSGVILIELRQAVSPFNTLAKLHWNAATGKVELVTTSGTTVVWAAPQSGPVNASLLLNDNRTITAKVGGLTATSTPATSSIGRAFVASATPYWLKKY